jgi:hypothetical protein
MYSWREVRTFSQPLTVDRDVKEGEATPEAKPNDEVLVLRPMAGGHAGGGHVRVQAGPDHLRKCGHFRNMNAYQAMQPPRAGAKALPSPRTTALCQLKSFKTI